MTLKGCILLNDEAISPVLGAVLILAIGMTLLTTVQVSFMPVWNAEEELNHLEKMNDDFKELKSSVESSAVSGTALSSPLSMGFKYSQKIIGYNPRERAYATFNIQKDTWAEVRYNEMFPEGMDDATSIKNITSSTITYSLLTPQNLSPFIYEHGLIRRGGSNYTLGAQSLIANDTLYLLSVNATEPEATTSAERRVINIYPTSPAKNSIIGRNVWLTLHTEYVDWWADDPNNPSSIQNLGGTIKKKDSVNGNIIAFFEGMEIRMGETQVTARSKKPPSRLPQYRLVKVSPQNVNLPVEGITNLAVEVQDYYNNPVPNVPITLTVNSSRQPANAFSTAELLQNSVISGADGRANVQLKTSGAGLYYIDASAEGVSSATFVYPASSQGGFISLSYTGSEPLYAITATLRDRFGETDNGETISFSASEGTVSPPTDDTDAAGNASTVLDTSTATGIKLTNIQTGNVTNSSANITWDTKNTITVAANRTPGGYVFNSVDVPTNVNSNGCVRYGTTPENYPEISCSAFGSSHTATLSGLQQYTAYYFIVNSSRSGGASVNSSEYMFVTEPAADTTPPASVTSLINETYEPLFIRWTWTDPADTDFAYVQVYIDGVSNGTVAKGVRAFNASYFMPNSTHTISTRTVDTSNNVNATWVNWTANTSSVFTYVFDFLNITGTVTSFDNARNASDGGASALFNESFSGGTAESNNYTNVTGYTAANGTVTGFANMQSAIDGGAFATLTEGLGTTTKSDRTMNPGKTITNGTQSGIYTSSNLDNIDGLVDITNPLISGTISKTGYLMNTVKTGVGGTTYWNINETAGGAADTTTRITLGGTADRRYVFRPGANNNKNSGTPGATPAGYGWASSSPINGITGAGTWSFQVRTTSTVTTRNGRILVYVYKYNATTGTNTFLFSVTGTANHLGGSPTTEIITSAVQPEYVFNSDEYLKVEYWLYAITTLNNAVIRFEANTATPYVQYTKNRYSLNTTYTFTETNSSATWQSISITDSSYGDPLGNVSMFNITSGSWEAILTSAFTGGAAPTQNVNIIKGANGNASSYDSGGGQIKIMYNWTNAGFNSTLGVDLINVTVGYAASTYLLNITTNTTSVPVDTNYYLEIYHRRDANETGYDVYVYNGTGWTLKGSLTSLTWSPANFTLGSSEVINGNVSVRYIDQTPAGSTQGNLSIDYQRIHGYTPATPAAYRLEITTSTTNIPDAANQTLQLRYNVSNDNFTVQVWSGSDWDYRTTLNDTVMSYRDIILLPGDLQSDGAFTGGSVGDLNKYYVRVRYTDVDASASQQGRLYLDYQRVYST